MWQQSLSTVILESKKIKSASVSTFSTSVCHEVMEPDAMILGFWMFSFKPVYSLSCFTLVKMLFSSSSLSAVRVVSSEYLRLLIFHPAILIPGCEPGISHHVLCIEVKYARWQYAALTYFFLNFEPIHCCMPGSNCCFLTCLQGILFFCLF